MSEPATPKYSVGDTVIYRDRQSRLQKGEVSRIEAHWSSWGGTDPTIIYSLHHPTYARNNFYTSDEGIVGLANPIHQLNPAALF